MELSITTGKERLYRGIIVAQFVILFIAYSGQKFTKEQLEYGMYAVIGCFCAYMLLNRKALEFPANVEGMQKLATRYLNDPNLGLGPQAANMTHDTIQVDEIPGLYMYAQYSPYDGEFWTLKARINDKTGGLIHVGKKQKQMDEVKKEDENSHFARESIKSGKGGIAEAISEKMKGEVGGKRDMREEDGGD
jgi:hypothetical protein